LNLHAFNPETSEYDINVSGTSVLKGMEMVADDDNTDTIAAELACSYRTFPYMSQYIYYFTDSRLYVDNSTLHGQGVFARTEILDDIQLTYYPGTVQILHANIFHEYGLQLSKSYYLEAANKVEVATGGQAHRFNTCHPDLPYPYNTASAVFQRVVTGKTIRKPKTGLRIGAVAYSCDYIEAEQEILADYHWFITGMYHPLVGRVLVCTCRNCTEF
jgi:hypothetical protein